MKIKRALLITLSAMLLPAAAMAQTDVPPADGTAVFVVQKNFEDGNDETAVTLFMSCTSGNPVEQQSTVLPGGNNFLNGQFEVAFVLDNIPDTDDVNCTITEQGTGGYTADYRCHPSSESNRDPSCRQWDTDSTACVFNDVEVGDQNLCLIKNYPNPATIEITKEWIVEGAGGNALDFEAQIYVESTAFIDGSSLYCRGNKGDNLIENGNYCRNVTFDKGPGSETKSLTVYPTYKGASIYVSETIYDSSFDSDNDCNGMMSVMPTGYEGASGMDSCTFTNTAYFEGIPTLNQYGMAIMALLMLGMGFIGFRRFV